MKSPCPHLLAVGPWANYITSLGFHFLVSKAEIIAGCNLLDYLFNTWKNVLKGVWHRVSSQ